MARIYRWFWSHHWPHINDSVTFQMPIRLGTSCSKTKEIKKNETKHFKKNTSQQREETTENTKDITSCKRMCTWNRLRNNTRNLSSQKSLSVTLQEVYFLQTVLLKSLVCEQCLFSSKFGEGTTQTKTMGERYWMCQPPLASVRLRSSPLIFKCKRDYSQSKKKPVDRTISRLL